MYKTGKNMNDILLRRAHRAMRSRSGVLYSDFVKLIPEQRHEVVVLAASLRFSAFSGKKEVIDKINARIKKLKGGR